MALDARLLEILACPDDKGPLYYFEADRFLLCPACRRRYEVRDDIPVMLIDEATVLSAGRRSRPGADVRLWSRPR